ncbi:hypothetical protein CMV_016363 [Castanea mollissima]|uniref:Uncharacterized protein n=1 Tax=Castanea mollissima TaxID=60419 RepID=A0A8J4R848_9ROSI|nr:hypothetical protein CMV_016363 [Castanea mollissima]
MLDTERVLRSLSAASTYRKKNLWASTLSGYISATIRSSEPIPGYSLEGTEREATYPLPHNRTGSGFSTSSVLTGGNCNICCCFCIECLWAVFIFLYNKMKGYNRRLVKDKCAILLGLETGRVPITVYKCWG